jgi:hypothetical protein
MSWWKPWAKPKVIETTVEKKPDPPHVQLVGSAYNEKDGVRIELDWNDEFITYLNSQGISGVDDEQTVQKWLAKLSQAIVEDLDNNVKKNNISDFN